MQLGCIPTVRPRLGIVDGRPDGRALVNDVVDVDVAPAEQQVPRRDDEMDMAAFALDDDLSCPAVIPATWGDGGHAGGPMAPISRPSPPKPARGLDRAAPGRNG